MKREEALQRISEIQKIAEKTTLYSLLPGYASVIGGSLALAGCFVSYFILRSFDFSLLAGFPAAEQFLFIGMWVVICLAAVAQEIILSVRDARKKGISPLGRPGKLTILSLTPGVIIALIFTLKVLIDLNKGLAEHIIHYIAPVWMMCYGAGVYAAGLFSVRLPRMLGTAFMIFGAVSMFFFQQYGLIMVALSFGMLHIIFGFIIIMRKRRT